MEKGHWIRNDPSSEFFSVCSFSLMCSVSYDVFELCTDFLHEVGTDGSRGQARLHPCEMKHQTRVDLLEEGSERDSSL